MSSYRDLDIFKEAKRLAIKVHKMTLTLPKFEQFEEGSQIRRSSKSVAAMIVEGYGRRRYKADCIKYIVYALTECDETILHLDLLYETGSLSNKECYDTLKGEYDLLSKKINNFLQWAENKLNEK
jgi:four helix bundle protein